MQKKYQILSIGLILASLGLTGCGTLYSNPSRGPVANLRVIADKSEGYFVFTRDITQICSRSSPNFPMLGANRKPDLETHKMPDGASPSYDRFERIIPANSPIKLLASSMRVVGFGEGLLGTTSAGANAMRNSLWGCNLRYTFTPEEGRNYEVHYGFSPEHCDLSIEDISTLDGKLVRKKVPFDIKEGASCDK